MAEKLLPAEMDDFSNGMDNVENIKKLPPNVLNYLHNAYPDTSLKPLHGINDVDSEDDRTGALFGNNMHFYPVFEVINVSGYKDSTGSYKDTYDKEFLFIVVQDRDATDSVQYYNIEIWDLSDGTISYQVRFRYGQQFSFTAPATLSQANRVYFSLTKKYNSVYLNMDQNIISDNVVDYDDSKIDRYGKIFEYDVTNDTWTHRSNSIDYVPDVDIFEPVDTTGTVYELSFYPTNSFYSATVHNNTIYKVGGYGGGFGYDDVQDSKVYKTFDTISWNQDSVYPNKFVVGAQMVSFEGGLYFIQGTDGNLNYNRSIYKKVGNVWEYYSIGPWSNREGMASCVYDNKIWVIGGRFRTDAVLTNDVYYNTVYSSQDGITWTLVTSSAIGGTSGVGYTSMTVYDGKMWVAGGIQWDGATETLTDNVYYSTDGITWTLAGNVGYANARHSQGFTAFEGAMYLFGGQDWSGGLWVGNPHNDVYTSTDGNTWTLTTAAAYASKNNRDTPILLNFLGKMTVINSNNSLTTINGVAWSINAAGLEAGKYYSYAFTFVRRTDYDSILHTDEYDTDEYIMTNWQTYDGIQISSVDERMLTGTVSVSGNNVTGTGTLFTTELAEDDWIRIGGSRNSHQVTSITNNTTMTVSNSTGTTYTDSPYAQMPGDGDSVTTNIYNPGVLEGADDINQRALVYNNNAGYAPIITFNKRTFDGVDFAAYINWGILHGATHIRVYRTLGNTDAEVAKGLDHRFLVDISITGYGAFSHPKSYYFDTVTDNELSGVTNFLETTGYSPVPFGKYAVWANNMYWISGFTEYTRSSPVPATYDTFEKKNGYLYHSVAPGTTGVSFDVLNPQKFAGMFNLATGYLTCDPGSNQKDTGLAVLEGDLYFFKEQSIFVIYNADPLNNPVLVTDAYGCICPNSITLADVPVLGGKVLFFISGEGMAYIRPGGAVSLFKDFKITYLEKDGGIMQRSATGYEGLPTNFYSRYQVSCSYWDNTLWVCAGDYVDDYSQINEGASSNGRNVMFGFHFAPDNESTGVFIRDFTTIRDKYEPRCLVPVDSRRAYTFSNRSEFKITRFQDPTQYIDTLIESDTPENHNNTVKLITRSYQSDNSYIYQWLARRVIIYVDFNDTDTFTIKIYTDINRQVATCTYSEVRNSGTQAGSDYQYRDFISIICGDDLRHAHYHHFEISKQIPSTGDLEIHGIRYIVDDKNERESPEHMDSFGAASNKTFVVQADTDPEVDAHA